MAIVYAYGCMRPSKEVRAQIREQLWLAYRYRFMLWQLAMAGRTHYRELRRKHVPELVEIEEKIVRIAELFELVEDAKEKQALKTELQRLRAKAKELREAAKQHAGLAADAGEAQTRQFVLQRALRKVFSRVLGLYSGTYLHVEAAARSANAGTEDPVRPRWSGGEFDGSGALAIQLQGGRTPLTLFSGDDPSLRIIRPEVFGKSKRARTKALYRLRSDEKGKGVFVELDFPMSRDLPADSRATWAKLVVKRIHEFRFTYSLQLTLDTPAQATRATGHGTVAVCFAKDKVTCLDDRGERFELEPFVEPKKLRDLQSIRDQMRNDAIGWLVGWCDRQDETADWVREEIALIQERKSCRRLYHLRERLRGVVDEAISRNLDTWAYDENHLYWWHNDLRRSALFRRRHLQRNFAKHMRERYDTILLDSRCLMDDVKPLTVARRWMGLHELRTGLSRSFGERVVSLTGESCEEMFERWRDAGVARGDEKTTVSDEKSGTKKVKRTGFARKHRERLEDVRNTSSKVSEQ